MQAMPLRDVYIVDGARSPFLRATGKRGPFSASDLGTRVGSSLLSKLGVSPEWLDEVVMGCIIPSEDEANIARIIALRLGCGHHVPGYTVQRNCASSMQSIDSAYKDIAVGRANLVMAGGTETMSRAPLIFQPKMADWFVQLSRAKTMGKKLKLLSQFKLRNLKPIISLLHGLSDFSTNHDMGQSTEELTYLFNITRQDMDAFSLQSQLRAAQAQKNGGFENEIIPLYDPSGKVYEEDTGVRPSSTIEDLAKLRPCFDRTFGAITPGNSSQISDGAAMVLLASQEAIDQYQLPVLGKIVDTQWAGCDPLLMGLGPAYAVPPLLQRHQLSFDDIDYWELNEAFAAQSIACLKAWENDEFCCNKLGLSGAMGSIDPERLNIHGGAIALGHPVGATGTRIVLHVLKVLEKNQQKRGVATLCIGGGLGGAMLLERV